jgi:hypothetical protein
MAMTPRDLDAELMALEPSARSIPESMPSAQFVAPGPQFEPGFDAGLQIPPGPELEYPDFDLMAMMGEPEEIDDFDDADPLDLDGFDENLAEYLPQSALDRLADRVCSWVTLDIASRQSWERREALGMIALGITDEDLRGTPMDWQSNAVHPGLAQACINFWARAFGELWSNGRLAKCVVLGESDPEREAQAQRVSDYLNYLYQEEMPGADDELSRLLFRLPLSGSVFRKAYFCPIEKTVIVEFVEGADLVKPYKASDLRKAPRFTHRVRMSRNDLNRLVFEGYYLDVIHNQPQSESYGQQSEVESVIDNATGQQATGEGGEHDAEYDNRDELFECACTLNLSDYGWDDPMGEEWGVPYLVTVHAGEQKTLSIRRNWRAADPSKRRRLFVVEYKFLPGLDGYGFGLLHIAGGLAAAQTGLTRYLLDGCTLDTHGKLSGWVSQDVVGAGEIPGFELGKFKKIPQGSADELRKGFIFPEFRWSANNILETIQYLDKLMAFLVSSTESLIGEDNKNVPVGTQLARIEQGLKPFVSIFTLLHASLKRELRAVSELVADNLPDDGYPYATDGESKWILASDFDDRVDVVPASDPNVVTGLQRVAQAQAVQELVVSDPEVFGPHQRIAAYQNLLDVLRVANPERFLPPMDQPLPVELQQMQAQEQAAMQQAMAGAPPTANPVDAEVARKDAETSAKIQAMQADQQRKDAETAAKIEREAQRMQGDPNAQRRGDAAIQAQEQQAEIDRVAQEILQAAEARRAQMAQQAGGMTEGMV